MNEAQKEIMKSKITGLLNDIEDAKREVERCEVNLLHANTSLKAIKERKVLLEEGL